MCQSKLLHKNIKVLPAKRNVRIYALAVIRVFQNQSDLFLWEKDPFSYSAESVALSWRMPRVRPQPTCPGIPASLLTFPGVQWFLLLCCIPELKALLWRYKAIQVFSTLQPHSKGRVNEKATQFRQFKWGSRRAVLLLYWK